VCSPPENLEGTAVGKTAVLTWDAPEEIAGTFEGYNIYRDGTQINENPVLETEYSDINRPVGTYKYQVSALSNLCEETDKTEEITVTIAPEFCDPPTILSVIAEEFEGENAIIITWDEPENIDGELLGYDVYRNGKKLNEELFSESIRGLIDREEHEPGTYIYKVSAVYGHCSASSEDYSIVLSINDLSTASFSIYPNPTTGKLHIQSSKFKVQGVEFYDVMGKKLFEEKENLTVLRSYDLTLFPAGVYFVKIYSDNNITVTKRLVIMK